MTPDADLLAALDRAAQRWPGASRGELVRRLAVHGDRSALEERAAIAARRTAAIAELRELGADISTPDELELLRADWRR